MRRAKFSPEKRQLKKVQLNCDFTVVGGGLAGVCAAISAAREGIKVILLQDRPVLGGNASSEVRLWALGATSHLGNNNRWSREGGIIDEIMVENVYRNKEGNPHIFDSILIEKVQSEKNITMLLNTAVFNVVKNGDNKVKCVEGFNAQNMTLYEVQSPLFCDASGDGIVGYMAGAVYRVGAEEKEEMKEKFAPSADYGNMLGHSIFFYTKDTGKPVKFVAPDFALKDITQIPRHQHINASEHGCKFWWLEYGGLLDTIHDTEEIKYELWKVVYGVWDYIKNSGNFPEAETQTLEWVGSVPGKRESRRFEGLYMINQNDLINQNQFEDTIAYGGWAIDLHPAEGVYSPLSGCTQYHSKGIYSIPYRCFIGKDIENLFFVGRIISASHVAFGSTRVMATSGFCAQAIGMAAAMCYSQNIMPVEILEKDNLSSLQNKLNIKGQSIPFVPIDEKENLASNAIITVSSSTLLDTIPFNGSWIPLEFSSAQLLPLEIGIKYSFTVQLKVTESTIFVIELRRAERVQNYTPDTIVERLEIRVNKGEQEVKFSFNNTFYQNQYGFICFEKNEFIQIKSSKNRITGLVSVFQKYNKAVAKSSKQEPQGDIGVDAFEFWVPERRPLGNNIAMHIEPTIDAYSPKNIVNGYIRPTIRSNAWVANLEDKNPTLTLKWNEEQIINKITLYFDTDYDHPMETVQMGHPENVMPFCVRNYDIIDESGKILANVRDNYQTINVITLDNPVKSKAISLILQHPSEVVPASVFEVLVS